MFILLYLSTGGILGLQDKCLVRGENFESFGNIPPVFGDLDTPDGADIKGLGHPAPSAGSLPLLVSQPGAGEGEVAILPFLENPPLASFLLLQLTLDDGLLIFDEGRGPLGMITQKAAPLELGGVVLKHVKEPVRAELVDHRVLVTSVREGSGDQSREGLLLTFENFPTILET